MQGETNATSARDEQEDHIGLERLIFFSDAVFAIAITLLILDIRPTDIPGDATGQVSDGAMLDGLWSLWRHYLSYFLSFTVIGLIWIGHHRMFRYIKRYNAILMLLALLELMFIAFLPFPTALISEHYDSKVALMFYALVLACTGMVTAVLWWYASHNGRLLAEGIDLSQVGRSRAQLFIMPVLFVLSSIAALLSVALTWVMWIAILVISVADVIVSWHRPAGLAGFGSSLTHKE